MGSHFLTIDNNKAYISESLIDEINKKDNAKLEHLQTQIEIEEIKRSIQDLTFQIKLAQLYYLI